MKKYFAIWPSCCGCAIQFWANNVAEVKKEIRSFLGTNKMPNNTQIWEA
jgi:hypothetical protein